MNTFSRRRFLKISGTTLLTSADLKAMNPLVKSAGKIEEKLGSSSKVIKKIPTYCSMCFWKCSAIASVRDGKLWKIEGNPQDQKPV